MSFSHFDTVYLGEQAGAGSSAQCDDVKKCKILKKLRPRWR
jgi:hypothetical protein